MKQKALHHQWPRELGSTSRGMMFLDGSFATAQSLRAVEGRPAPPDGHDPGAAARGFAAAALAAALMVAPALASLGNDGATLPRSSESIVDLPAVTVRPSAADAAAYRHSRRVVELDTVVVRPRAVDRAFHLATIDSRAQRLASIDMRP